MTERSPSVQLLSPRVSTSAKHESTVAHKIQLQQQDANCPIPQISLHKLRFLIVALLGVAMTGAGLASFLSGVVIVKDVADPIGTSTEADNRVENFQAVNGFVWAAVGLLLEEYFKIFIAAILIYFTNLKWHPKDDVATNGPTKFKLRALFWFTPLIMYVLNIGLSSVFIEHNVDRIGHALNNADLAGFSSLSVETFSTRNTTSGNSVMDTVLRTAVMGYVQPFTLNPNASCAKLDSRPTGKFNTFKTLPKLQKLQSTSVTYGFTPRSWNLDAVPYAVKPTSSFKFGHGPDMTTIEADLTKYLKTNNIDFRTLADLMIQGQTLHGQVVSDSNSLAHHDCGASSDTSTTPQCYGAGDFLLSLKDFDSPKHQTGEALLNSVTDMGGLMVENATIELETMTLSPLINLTMMTIDIPYKDNQYYKAVGNLCNTTSHQFKDPEYWKNLTNDSTLYKASEKLLCSPSEVTFYAPFEQCGESNCVLQDTSDVMNFNFQIKMMPFRTNCNVTARGYDKNTLAWYPRSCKQSSEQELFLYGAGAYFTGTFTPHGKQDGGTIMNPRRHQKLTYAKLTYAFEDLSMRFDGAKCFDDNNNESNDACDGMIHPLQNVNKQDNDKSRVLLVSKDQVLASIRGPRGNLSMHNPLTLATLRQPKFFNLVDDTPYFTFEVIDMSLMNTTYNESQTLGLDNGYCSLYIDAFINQIKNNHYYIQDPRQALYTSAVYLLFQNAAVKEVTSSDSVVDLNKPVIGKARMKEDYEIVVIRYSIPLPSVVSTGIGIMIIILYMAIIIKWPRDAVKLTDEVNAAAQYADVLIDDSYPERVHTRRLKLSDGTVVEMDDYATKKIVFRNRYAPGMPVVME